MPGATVEPDGLEVPTMGAGARRRGSGPWAMAVSAVVLVGAGYAIRPTLSMAERSATAAAGETVRAIRGAVEYHRGDAAIRTTSTGWPMSISADWFAGRDMPRHPLTGDPLLVEAVDEPAAHVAPQVKSFDPVVRDLPAVWYNRTNGSVCLRVPRVGSEADRLAMFNELNGTALTSLGARR